MALGMDEQRLTRIEDKLDKLTEGFSALVRMDEKMIGVFQRMAVYDQAQERMSVRVTALEAVNYGRGPLFDWMGRIAMMAVGAAVVFAVNMWMGGRP